MNITAISIERLAGVREFQLAVDRRNVLLHGPIGSGKSTVINAIHLVLGLPTPYGERNLDRLSATGSWSAQLMFDDKTVRSLERQQRGPKGTFLLNGRKVARAAYLEAVRGVLDVEDHHVSLDAFLGLSGQRRAAMFAEMLEQASSSTVAEVVQAVEGRDLDVVVRDLVEEDEKASVALIRRLDALAGSPAELSEAMRQLGSELTTAEREARVRLDGLLESRAGASHGQNPEELKRLIATEDEQLGALKGKKEDLERDQERSNAAQKVLESHVRGLEKDRVELARKKAVAEKAGQLRAAATAAKEALDAKDAELKALGDEVTEINGAKRAVNEQLDRLRANRALVADLLGQDWVVDADWLDGEIEQLLEPIDAAVKADGGAYEIDRDRFVGFAREVVAEVFGGSVEKLDEAIAKVEEGPLAEANARDKEVADKITALREPLVAATKACTDAAKAADEAEAAAKEVVELEKQVAAKEDERATLEQKVNETAVPADEAVVDAQIEQHQTERNRLAGLLRELEEAQAISGQAEAQRVEVIRNELMSRAAKALSEIVQRWRNEIVSDQLAKVMDPFREAFEVVWGQNMQLGHTSSGAGRATEFEFTVRRRGVDVPFDLLSDGETVLTAAAFLTALQRIKPGPGTILTMNTEALNRDGLLQLAQAVPKLGLDFVAIANNRAGPDGLELLDTLTDDWQFVEIGAGVPV